jgi:hypothetical protein
MQRRKFPHRQAKTVANQILLKAEFNPSDSEISDLSDDNDADEVNTTSATNQENLTSSESDSESDEDTAPNPAIPQQYRWRNCDLQAPGLPPVNPNFVNADSVRSPIDYFKQYFPDALRADITFQSNLYANQHLSTARPPCLAPSEIDRFIGISLYLGIYNIPSTRMAWQRESRINVIADSLSRNRYEEVRKWLHFTDNTTPHDGNDRLWKVRPVINVLQATMATLKMEGEYSIDEQMCGYQGRTQLRQYMPNKPCRWGIKVFCLCGVSGITYKFFIYDCQNPFEGNFTSGLVMHLCNGLEKYSRLYCDNFFTSIALFVQLKEMGIYATGTLRSNRSCGATILMLSDKELSKKGRGSHDQRTDQFKGVTVVKWYDNRAVLLASTLNGIDPLGTLERWDKKLKASRQIPAPALITDYNHHMGGVDFADRLLSMYAIPVKTNKWTMRLFYHFLDVAVVNSWLLYRRDCEFFHIPKRDQMKLLDFRSRIAYVLCSSQLPQRKRSAGRISVESQGCSSGKRDKRLPLYSETQLDGIGHWPTVVEKRERCTLCSTTLHAVFSRTKCIKCDRHLCLNGERNCFISFHM